MCALSDFRNSLSYWLMLTILHSVNNQATRDLWVSQTITELSQTRRRGRMSLLDAGAGQQPYRKVIESLGIAYSSHDFNSYAPTNEEAGLHIEWPHLEHDYVCDILAIPTQTVFDIVLCTEVLEHVPDPVAALEHLSKLVRSGGHLIATAPLLSLIHQAPFHFSSGLTPFWYQHWMSRNNLEIEKIVQHGDYGDLLSQEIRRLLKLPGFLQKPISNLLRPFIPLDLASSGGFSVFVLAKKM